MSSIDIFKAHHTKIYSLITELSDRLHAEQIADNASLLSEKFQLLFKVILLHLDAEDMLLYPNMLGCGNEKASALAKEYQLEMGWLADSFKSFIEHWSLKDNMISNPAKFCREAHKMIHSLQERIDKEERHLYPEFEQAERS